MSNQPKIGVLLANTGSPTDLTKKEMKRYLGRFLMDERIAPMNRGLWWLILHGRILPRRSKRNVERYEKIWTDEGNPFILAHEKLEKGLNRTFEEELAINNVVVVTGFSYSDPDILEGLSALQEEGCDEVLVLPLYPQSAYSTTGSVFDAVERETTKMKWDVPCHIIDNYHDNSTYARAIAASIVHAGFDVDSNDKLLFSYHSIPLADIEAGDTYELQSNASSLAIANELGIERNRWTIGYQCRFDKGREWLKPYSRDILERWAKVGEGRVFMVCPNFSVDCLETIYDINVELKPHYLEACREAGREVDDEDFIYVPCLDKSKAHISVLKDILLPYIEEINDGKH